MPNAANDPLCRAFIEAHPREAALILERLPDEDVVAFLGDLEPATSSSLVRHLSAPAAARRLEAMTADRAAAVLAAIPPNMALGPLRCMDEGARAAILASLPKRAAQKLRAAIGLADGAVGAVMDPGVETVAAESSVADVVGAAKQASGGLARYMYALDDDRRLVGVIDVRELLVEDPDTTIARVMHRKVISVPANAKLSAIRQHPAWETFNVLPVTDRRGTFLGVLRRSAFRFERAFSGHRSGDGEGKTDSLLDVADLVWEVGAEVIMSAIARPRGKR